MAEAWSVAGLHRPYRIDIQIEVPALPPEDLSHGSGGESSSVIRERVTQARARMIARQGKENARLATREIERHCGAR